MKIIFNRILNSVILLLGICILNFLLVYSTPGDPSNLYFGLANSKRENLKALRQKMGLEQPFLKQIKVWTTRLLHGDLGYSWAKHRPVVEILKEAIPATLQLTLCALLFNIIVGCIYGILAGIYSDAWLGRLLNYCSLVLYSIPTFWLALILILFFSLKLHWLPASQMNSFFITEMGFWSTLWDRLLHLILPVIVLGLTGAAATSRYVRAQMIAVLKQDYIRMAYAKGLPQKRVFFQHAFKNALLPVITLLGIYFPFLLSGVFLVEVIFAWPGMGRVAYEAIFAKDYAVILAVNLIAAVLVIFGNLFADLMYRFIDPRIHLK